VGGFFGAVPVVAAIDGNVVTVGSEARTDLVDSLLSAASDKWIYDITNKTDVHR